MPVDSDGRMQAARLHGVRDLRVEQVDSPAIAADDEVLIRIHACGICPSDLRAYTGVRAPSWDTPYIPGHEWAGEVLAVVEGRGESSRSGTSFLGSGFGCNFSRSGRSSRSRCRG